MKPDTLRFKEAGWHLFTNPFPFPVSEASLILDSTAISAAFAMMRSDTTEGSPAKYAWVPTSTFRPFEGYLIYAFKATEIIFDPLLLGSKGLLKSAGRGEGAKRLKVILSSRKEYSAMSFYSGGRLRNTPYLKPPEAGMEVRVGGGGGWLLKAEPNLDSIHAALEVSALEPGTVAFQLQDEDGSDRDAALIDLQSGHIYGKAELGAVQVHPGTNAFSFLYGKAVSPGVANHGAGLPSMLALEQNHPNPFRGQTRIRFQVPANMGRVLEADLEVTNLAGRIVQSISMGSIALGTHQIMVGNGAWEPGIYIYRLTLKTDRRVISSKRKMICGMGAI